MKILSLLVVVSALVTSEVDAAGPTAAATPLGHDGIYDGPVPRGPEDNRDEVLLVYDVEEAQRGVINAVDGGPLDGLFRGARR